MQYNNLSLRPLTLYVKREIEVTDKILQLLSNERQVISIGRELSTFLVTQNEAGYLSAIRQWLDETLRQMAPGPILCTDIDFLFHPSLKLDPLILFRQISRHTKLIVLWPGEYKDGVLSYAQPEHKHYRFWKNLEGIEIKGASDAL